MRSLYHLKNKITLKSLTFEEWDCIEITLTFEEWDCIKFTLTFQERDYIEITLAFEEWDCIESTLTFEERDYLGITLTFDKQTVRGVDSWFINFSFIFDDFMPRVFVSL